MFSFNLLIKDYTYYGEIKTFFLKKWESYSWARPYICMSTYMVLYTHTHTHTHKHTYICINLCHIIVKHEIEIIIS